MQSIFRVWPYYFPLCKQLKWVACTQLWIQHFSLNKIWSFQFAANDSFVTDASTDEWVCQRCKTCICRTRKTALFYGNCPPPHAIQLLKQVLSYLNNILWVRKGVSESLHFEQVLKWNSRKNNDIDRWARLCREQASYADILFFSN